jgi:hypothetical protein
LEIDPKKNSTHSTPTPKKPKRNKTKPPGAFSLAPWFVIVLIIINRGYLFFQIIHLFVDELEQYLGSSTFLHNRPPLTLRANL